MMNEHLFYDLKAARWAAERGTVEGYALIREAQARMEQERGSIEDFVVADALFHRAGPDAILAGDAAGAKARMERLLGDARHRLGDENAQAAGADRPAPGNPER